MSERDHDNPTPPSPESAEDRALSRRLHDLETKLDKRRAVTEAEVRAERQPPRQGMALALRLGADFVAGVVVGAALGWGIDRLFGTSPWALIVCLLFGFAAGVLSVMRTAGMINPGPPSPGDNV